MVPPQAFVQSYFFATPIRRHPLIDPLRPHKVAARRVAAPTVTTAVLDTPAGNTYLQRHAEVVLRDFLTRRAVNTVMYYMQELGDGPSRQWLAKFDNFSEKVKADEFKDGDSYIDKMMRARREKGSFNVSHLGGRLSRTYYFTIEPNRIANRILAVRKQLSGEWAKDLKCIENENLEIQRMEFEKMLTKDERVLQSKRNLIFDTDPFSNENTPLRYKNYLALKTLVTRHAVARLLPYMRDSGSNHEYMYLLQYVNSYGPIEDGDGFVRDLMAKPIEMRTNPDYTIQPRGLALQVLELRDAIAQEWIAVMQCIPDEQNLMTRNILERSMEMSNNLGEDIRRPKPKTDTPEAQLDKDGEESETSN